MDDRRFDSWVKSLARARNRRSVLGGIAGLGSVALAGAAHPPDASAARRPAPAPKPVAHCPGQQLWTGASCICPDPLDVCGPDCCNDSALAGTRDHSECCDNACCVGHCYGEELCCPWPRAFCEITSECCPDSAACCADSGCCDTNAGRCCAVFETDVCRAFDLCCADADCVDFANSTCDLATGQCVCTPDTCSGQFGAACGSDVDNGCGGVIDACSCANSPLVICGPESTCEFDCDYWHVLSLAGSVLEIAVHLCESVGLCDDDLVDVIDEMAVTCS